MAKGARIGSRVDLVQVRAACVCASRIATASLSSNRKAPSDRSGRLKMLLVCKLRPTCPKMGCAPFQQQERSRLPLPLSLPGGVGGGARPGGLGCTVLHTQMV